MYKRFRDYLVILNGKSMPDQKQFLDTALEQWMGSLEQIDDVLVIGMRID
jgi:hypothetical protein